MKANAGLSDARAPWNHTSVWSTEGEVCLEYRKTFRPRSISRAGSSRHGAWEEVQREWELEKNRHSRGPSVWLYQERVNSPAHEDNIALYSSLGKNSDLEQQREGGGGTNTTKWTPHQLRLGRFLVCTFIIGSAGEVRPL